MIVNCNLGNLKDRKAVAYEKNKYNYSILYIHDYMYISIIESSVTIFSIEH